MSTFSLDDIRAAADKKYASVKITFGNEVLEMLNPLRLPEDRRNKLIALQEELDSDKGDQGRLLEEAVRLVASDLKVAVAFLDEIDGDLAVLAAVFEKYNTGAEAGEA